MQKHQTIVKPAFCLADSLADAFPVRFEALEVGLRLFLDVIPWFSCLPSVLIPPSDITVRLQYG